MQNLIAFLSVLPLNFLTKLSLYPEESDFYTRYFRNKLHDSNKARKTGICKSVVISTVVAIRDVLENGFHCTAVKTGMFFISKAQDCR